VGSKALDVGSLSGGSHHVPDCLRGDSIAPDLAQPIYSTEDRATVNAGRCGPFIDGSFRPQRNWDGTDVLSFANQVSDYPALFANLEIRVPSPTSSARLRPQPIRSVRIDHVCLGGGLPVVHRVRSRTDPQSTNSQSAHPDALRLSLDGFLRPGQGSEGQYLRLHRRDASRRRDAY
jgi:hypothetical protein